MNAIVTMDAFTARQLTDEVKSDAAGMWTKLLALFENGAHVALGYQNWEAYFSAEFGEAKAHAYRMLDAGRVYRAIAPVSHGRLNERQARALAPLLDAGGEEAVAKAWQEVEQEFGDEITAKKVEIVVSRYVQRADVPTIVGESAGSAGRTKEPDDAKYVDPPRDGLAFSYAELAAIIRNQLDKYGDDWTIHQPSYLAGQLAVFEKAINDLGGA